MLKRLLVTSYFDHADVEAQAKLVSSGSRRIQVLARRCLVAW